MSLFSGSFGSGDIVAYLGIAGTTEFANALKTANGQVDDTTKLINQSLVVAVGAATAAFGTAVTASALFESKMANVHTLLGPSSEASKAFDNMNADILEMSTRIPQGPGALSDALYQVISATVPAKDAMNVLGTSAQAAIGGVANTADTFDLFSATIKGYGLEWTEVDRVSDIAFQTVALGVTTIQQLASSLQGAIPLTAEMKVPLEELSGAVATLTGVTGNTSEVTTQIESLLTALIKPTEQMQGLFEALKVASGKELIESMGGLSGALEAIKGYTEKYNVAIGDLLGRKEGLLAYFALTGQQAEDFRTKTEAMYNAAGAAKAAFDIQMNTFLSQAELFKNTVQVAFIDMGESSFLPILTDFLKGLNEHKEAVTATVTGISNLALSLGTLGGTYLAITKVSGALSTLIATPLGVFAIAIGSVVTAIVALNTVNDYLESKRLSDIDNISVQTGNLLKLEEQYRTLAEQENKTAEQEKTLSTITEGLKLLYADVGINAGDAATKMGNLGGEVINKRIEEVNGKISELNTTVDHNATSIAITDANSKSLFAEYGMYASVTKTLHEESKTLNGEVGAYETQLVKLQTQLEQKNIPATNSLNTSTQATVGSIQAQIDKYAALLPGTKDNYFAHADLLDKISALKGQMDVLSPSTDKVTASNIPLKDSTFAYGSELSTVMGMMFDVRGYQDTIDEGNKKITLSTNDATFAVIGYRDANEAVAAAEKLLEDPREKQIEQLELVLMNYEHTPAQAAKIEKAIKKLSEETDKGGKDFADYAKFIGDIINEIPGVDDGLKKFTTSLVNVVTSGFDPLTIATTAFSFIMGAFNNTTKVAVISTDELKERMGELGDRITEAQAALDNFGNEFESSLIEGKQKALKGLMEHAAELTTMYDHAVTQGQKDQINKWYYETNVAINKLLEDIERLTKAFQFDTDFSNAKEGLDYLSSKALEMTDYFGSAFDNAGLQELLNESITANKEILATLDPTTQAYIDMQESIWKAEAAMAVMRGEVETATQYYEQHGIVIAGVNDQLNQNNDELEENIDKVKTWSEIWTEAIDGLNGDFNQWTKDANSVNKLLDQLEYFNIDLIGSDYQDDISKFMGELNQQLSELDPNSQAWADLKKIIDDLTLRIYDMTYGTDQLSTSVNNTADDLKATIDAINIKIASYTGAVAAMQQQKTEIEVQITAKKDAVKGLNAFILEKAKELADLPIKFSADLISLRQELQDAQNEVARISQEHNDKNSALTLDIQLKEADKKSLSDIIGQLEKYKSALNMDYGKGGFKKAMEEMDFYEISKAIENLTGKTTELTIAWGEMVDEMFSEYSGFENDLKTATEAIDQILYFNLDLDTTEADEQINAAIFRMQDYLKTLNPDSDAYREAKKGLDELIKKFESMGGELDREKALDLNIDLAGDGIDNIDQEIQDLYDQITQNDLQFNIDVQAAMDNVEAVNLKIQELYSKYAEEHLKITTDIQDAKDQIDVLNQDINDLNAINLQLDIDIQAALDQIEILKRQLKDLQNPQLQIGGDKKGGGGDTLHVGGYPTAHTGLLFPNETLAKIDKREFVLRPEVTDRFGPERLKTFNASLDPDVFNDKKQNDPVQYIGQSDPVNVIVHEAGPQTYVEITDKYIHPRIQTRDRNFKAGSSPYKR